MLDKIGPLNSCTEPDYIFINYATEDYAFADWLTKKLTALGYNVWIDRKKLLGGESYPSEFPDIIKNKTFRFLALLSTYSLTKENPARERAVASNVKRENKINDFVIPLKLDDFPNVDLPFFEVNLSYIPFHLSWGQGLLQLVQKLESIGAPKSDGPIQRALRDQLISEHMPEVRQETLISNIYKILEIPHSLLVFKKPKKADYLSLSFKWAYYKEGEYLFAFREPPPSKINFTLIGRYELKDVTQTKNVTNIVTFLLRKELDLFCINKGMVKTKIGQKLIFQKNTLTNDKIYYKNVRDKRTYKTMIGLSKKFFYYISPKFRLSLEDLPFPSLTIVPTLYWTTESGMLLSREKAFKKSKKLRKNWWNNKWLQIVTAIAFWLGSGDKQVDIFNSTCGTFKISLEPIVALSDFGIDESNFQTESDHPVDEAKVSTEELINV